MITKSEIQTENIYSVGFRDDMREGATLRRFIYITELRMYIYQKPHEILRNVFEIAYL
jgi:hypothetical protein